MLVREVHCPVPSRAMDTSTLVSFVTRVTVAERAAAGAGGTWPRVRARAPLVLRRDRRALPDDGGEGVRGNARRRGPFRGGPTVPPPPASPAVASPSAHHSPHLGCCRPPHRPRYSPRPRH